MAANPINFPPLLPTLADISTSNALPDEVRELDSVAAAGHFFQNLSEHLARYIAHIAISRPEQVSALSVKTAESIRQLTDINTNMLRLFVDLLRMVTLNSSIYNLSPSDDRSFRNVLLETFDDCATEDFTLILDGSDLCKITTKSYFEQLIPTRKNIYKNERGPEKTNFTRFGPGPLHDKSNFLRGPRLGSGGFGTVYSANFRETHDSVALKLMEQYRGLGSSLHMTKKVLDEITHLRKAEGVYVPEVYAVVHDNQDDNVLVGLAMEMCLGSLADAIHPPLKHPELRDAFGDGQWNLKTKMRIMRDISYGASFLHANDIIHRDLKPNNILITSTGQIKITDFGDARGSLTVFDTSSDVGTFPYRAPELYSDIPDTILTYSSASDVYALGITFNELLSGEAPFLNMWHNRLQVGVTQKAFIHDLLRRGTRPTMFTPCITEEENALSNTIQCMWRGSDASRPKTDIVADRLDQLLLQWYHTYSSRLKNSFCGSCCTASS